MPPETFRHRRYRLPRQRMAWLRFLNEGYDGLLFIRTLDGKAGVVDCSWSPSLSEEAECLLAMLARECGMTPLAEDE